MQNLLKAIPSKSEWQGMDEEQRGYLFFTLHERLKAHDLPEVGQNYHPAETMALMLSSYPYLMDMVVEFDLEVDYNE
jgi:hypothetical protein